MRLRGLSASSMEESARRLVVAVRAWSDRRRRMLLAIAAVMFIAGISISIKQVEFGWERIYGFYVLSILVLGFPLTAILRAEEFRLCARSVGKNFGIMRSVAITSTANVSNLLPLPAGLAIRGGFLVEAGASFRDTGEILFLASMLWLSMAIGISGLAAANVHSLALIAGGLGILFSVGFAFWIKRKTSPRIAVGFIVVRASLLSVSVFRLWLAFAAIGIPISLSESTYYALASIVGSMAIVVPGGLGVSEGLGALIAVVTGGVPAAAFLALALNRLLEITANGVIMLSWSMVGQRFSRS